GRKTTRKPPRLSWRSGRRYSAGRNGALPACCRKCACAPAAASHLHFVDGTTGFEGGVCQSRNAQRQNGTEATLSRTCPVEVRKTMRPPSATSLSTLRGLRFQGGGNRGRQDGIALVVRNRDFPLNCRMRPDCGISATASRSSDPEEPAAGVGSIGGG